MKITLRVHFLAMPIALLVCAFSAQAAAPESETASRLDKRLEPIAAAAQRHLEAPLRDAALAREATQSTSPFEPRWNAAGQVQVYLHYDRANAAPDLEQLRSLGATGMVNSAELGVIQAWVPAAQLNAVSTVPGVLRVGMPRYAFHKRSVIHGPMAYTGSVDTQGDTILQAAAFRKSTGDTGQGVTVGVISDGDDHISASEQSKNLPGNIWNDPKDAGGKSGFSPASSGDEGTAMMEIVYDMAPGVDRLGFCGPQTSVDFVTCLGDFKANIAPEVIVDDLGFPGGAMFSEDTFTSAVASFAQANPNVRLVTAAGNDGTGFWEGSWSAMGVSTSANGVAYTQALDFGGGNPDLQINVRPGDTINYIVEWDDAWSDTATKNDPNDFDVVVFTGPGGTGTAVACNQGINIGPDPNNSSSTQCDEAKSKSLNSPGPQPIQGSQWTAHSSTYYLEVFGVHGSLTGKRLKVLVFDQNAFQVVVSPSTSGSIYGHAALPQPLETTVGAVNSSGNLPLESFSSTGPVAMGTGGSHTSVMKPDFVAPDCVHVTGAGNFEVPFCGTSAAAPHVAGLMALLISGYSQSPYSLLKDSATSRGSPVPNGDFGYGLPDMKTLLSKGLKPTPRPKSSGGGGGEFDLFALLVLGVMATWRRRRG